MPSGSRKRSKRLQTGMRRRPNGSIEAYLEIRGTSRSKVFPNGTPLSKIQLWRLQEREFLGGAAPTGGSLGQDVERYLKMVRTQRTYKNTAQMLATWCEWLGRDRPRSSVTTADLNEIIQKMIEVEGLAAGSVYRYCSVVQRMWTMLDGPGAPNPVRAAQKPPKDPLQARGLPPEEVEKLLNAIPASDELTICEIIAWTGLTHEQIRQLRPDDIFWDRSRIRTGGRRKGKTVEARVIPMLERGMDALHDFDEKKLYGKVNNYRVWAAVKRAGKKIGRGSIRPYDLRHSFATMIYETSRDLDGTAYLLNHASTSTTRRYALAAFDPVAVKTLELAAARLEERLGRRPRRGGRPDIVRSTR